MRNAIFTERGVTDCPAAMLAGKCHLQGLWASLQKLLQAELFRGKAQHARTDPAQKLLTRAVDDAQAKLLVESEDGHVNLHQHLFEQCRGFERTYLLRL